MSGPRRAPGQPQVQEARWYNYAFKTRLQCPRGCPIGTHPLYIGKSNLPMRRWMEHEQDKGWFPHHSGYEIYPERYATEAQSLAAEEKRIRGLRPLANDKHNEHNPCRMHFPPRAPDRHPVRATRPRPSAAKRPTRQRSRRRWTRGQKHAVGWLTLWLALSVVLACLTAGKVGAERAFVSGPISAAVVLLALRFWPRTRRRRSR